MEDFRNKEVTVGATVAFINGYSGSAVYLSEGIVTRILPSGVKVQYGYGQEKLVKPARLVVLT